MLHGVEHGLPKIWISNFPHIILCPCLPLRLNSFGILVFLSSQVLSLSPSHPSAHSPPPPPEVVSFSPVLPPFLPVLAQLHDVHSSIRNPLRTKMNGNKQAWVSRSERRVERNMKAVQNKAGRRKAKEGKQRQKDRGCRKQGAGKKR